MKQTLGWVVSHFPIDVWKGDVLERYAQKKDSCQRRNGSGLVQLDSRMGMWT